MHPSGVQFGLSRGLLQLRGEEVLLSQQLIDAVSAQAQQHVQLGRPPIQGNFLVDMTIRAAQDSLQTQHQGRTEEMIPFFTALNQTMYYTFCRLAEQAGAVNKTPRRLITNTKSGAVSAKRAVDTRLNRGKSEKNLGRALSQFYNNLAKRWYTKKAPETPRHSDLIALFM